jgi:trehalose 6-phosphate synthase
VRDSNAGLSLELPISKFGLVCLAKRTEKNRDLASTAASGETGVSVVVVSNRVAAAKAGEPISGGLAAALIPMVSKSGAIWVGSSGDVGGAYRARNPFASTRALGTGTIVTVDPPREHYVGFYEGFANSALWPALHSRVDLIDITDDHYASYREVNAFMARAVVRFDKADSIF